MSLPIHNDVFSDVINAMMQELHALPHSTDIIYRLITSNRNSPILAEIQHLSLSKLDVNQMVLMGQSLASMSNLTSLALPGCGLTPKNLKLLFTQYPLSKLRSLDLTGAHQLKSEDLTNLTSLNLAGCAVNVFRPPVAQRGDEYVRLGSYGTPRHGRKPEKTSKADSSGLIALFSSPVVKHLTHLNLSGTWIDDPLVHITIATSPYLSNLESLDLPIDATQPDAVAALAASTTLSNLTHLNTFEGLDKKLIAPLFSPPSLLVKKLQSIRISGNDMTAPSLEVLCNACPHLSELYLSWQYKLGSAGVALIATQMPNLTKLDLSFCDISDEGYASLASSTTLINLRELNLRANRARARAESIIAVINSPGLASLTHLDLGNTRSGPEVLTAIAQSPSMSKLQELLFYSNAAGDAGVIALAQSTTLQNLTRLDLSRNNIGSDVVKALCTSPVVSKLTYLCLDSNYVGNSIAEALAAPSSTLYSLVELSLEGVNMDDEGVLQLLTTTNLDQLDFLSVDYNKTNSSTKTAHSARFGQSI